MPVAEPRGPPFGVGDGLSRPVLTGRRIPRGRPQGSPLRRRVPAWRVWIRRGARLGTTRAAVRRRGRACPVPPSPAGASRAGDHKGRPYGVGYRLGASGSAVVPVAEPRGLPFGVGDGLVPSRLHRPGRATARPAGALGSPLRISPPRFVQRSNSSQCTTGTPTASAKCVWQPIFAVATTSGPCRVNARALRSLSSVAMPGCSRL